ncbi:SLAM family member 5-like isoform X2 [Hemicordylus capensis]|uniref:SLAM family member 5-like isoform X2 n=1 Tax=Hemicordylus capensis TaxID=884348 RepID=UPI002304966D|nr:SLAM family member 5-like isoform X2 [Hemicordylus capensis]
MESRSSWLTLLLLATQLAGTANDPAQHLTQLNRILGASVSFPEKLSSGKPVHTIYWSLRTTTSKLFPFVLVRNGTLEAVSSRIRFWQRLEMVDETTLRIKNLEVEDSGVYVVYMTVSHPPVVQRALFNLTVYEPVPEPQIFHQVDSKASDGCNVTLQCQVPGKRGFNVSWKRGDSLRDLEEDLDWYQVSSHGQNLNLFWRPNSSDSIFTCLVSNPVDQNNVSVNLLSICSNKGGDARLSWRSLRVPMIVVGLLGQIAAIALLNILERKDQNQI